MASTLSRIRRISFRIRLDNPLTSQYELSPHQITIATLDGWIAIHAEQEETARLRPGCFGSAGSGPRRVCALTGGVCAWEPALGVELEADVYGSILFRMILGELAKVFALSLIGITGILLMAGIIAEATQQGLSPIQVLEAIPLLIPSMLPYTIPATTLFAACVVYGRLAADNEILAIKSAGINPLFAVKPGLLLGLAMSGCTMGLYYHLIPHTHHLLRTMFLADTEGLIYSMLRRNGNINQPETAYSMFVKNVQGRNLVNTLFKRRDAHGQTDLVAQARAADLHVNVPKRQILVHMHCGVATLQDGSYAYFDDRVWEVPLSDKLAAPVKQRPRAMTWSELLARRAELPKDLKQSQDEVAMVQSAMQMFSKPPNVYVQHRKHLLSKQGVIKTRIREINVELLMRPALALSCFCFVLVGCPVGIWFSRSDFLSAFITCFTPICIVYYPLMLCGTNLAKEGKGLPWLFVWAANLCVGFVGLFLLVKLVRR